MCDVKNILKKNGKTISQFSDDFNVSRSTLYSYIDEYEKNKELKNTKFDKIFKELFSESVVETDFESLYKKYMRLITRDSFVGLEDISAEDTDLIMAIVNAMKRDVSNEGYDRDIYSFIRLIVKTYRNNSVFKDIASYFLVLNGISDIEKVVVSNDNMKVFLSEYYILMKKYVDGELKFNEENYEMYVRRVKQVNETINSQRELIVQELKQRINEKQNFTQDELRKLIDELN